MAEVIEIDPADYLRAGALGAPGRRRFLIQAARGELELSVLVEKAQVALLAVEAGQFLDRLDEELPVPPGPVEGPGAVEEAEPLFRARLIGIGFDAAREMVLLELRESARPEGEEPPDVESDEGRVARIFATRAQVRAMIESGVEAVAAGRPPCPLCELPMDPDGHRCPRWN